MALNPSSLANQIIVTFKDKNWKPDDLFYILREYFTKVFAHIHAELEITDLAKAFDNFDKTKLDRDTFTVLTASASTPIAVGSGSDEVVLVGTLGAPITVNLPASPFAGQYVVVKDAAGTAASWSVTVAGNGNNIDGAANQPISTNYGRLSLIYSGSQWHVI